MATPCLLISSGMLYNFAFRGCRWMVHRKRRLFYVASISLKPTYWSRFCLLFPIQQVTRDTFTKLYPIKQTSQVHGLFSFVSLFRVPYKHKTVHSYFKINYGIPLVIVWIPIALFQYNRKTRWQVRDSVRQMEDKGSDFYHNRASSRW